MRDRTPPLRVSAWTACLIAGLCAHLLAGLGSPTRSVAASPPLSDERILHAVEAEIQVDAAVPESWIDVDVHDGIITLWGTVDTLLAKERAGRLARTVKGVRAVLNEITVEPAQPVSDDTIRAGVGHALITDPATERFEIDVRVEEGVVTLEGSVDSWQERALAERVAKRVPGVRALRNEITFVPVPGRADDDIEADVVRRLEADAWIDESLIGVMVSNGAVSLTGTVGSASEKARAYADAWVAGVKAVDTSGLEVKWWARNEMRRDRSQTIRSDETVEDAVRAVLRYDPRVVPFEVGVRVRDGIVRLTGVVDNVQAKQAAAEDARATIGVRGVRNLLKVRPTQPPQDPVIERTVAQALLEDPHVRRHAIQVRVQGGMVRLDGVVDSIFEVAHAERVAARAPGVVDVDNHLRLRSPRRDEHDWIIKQEIVEQLQRSPYVDGEDITVSVDAGIATLTGRVDSWAAYRDATRQAFEGGAVRVRNELDVGTEDGRPPRGEDAGS